MTAIHNSILSDAPSAPRGWICPVCNSGIAPGVSSHCDNRNSGVYTTKTVGDTGKWCGLCNSVYFGNFHTCIGPNAGGIYTTNTDPSTVCHNGCFGLAGCSNCPVSPPL